MDSRIFIFSSFKNKLKYEFENSTILTASALNKGIPPIPETDTLLQGKTHTVNNYGIVEFSNSYLSLFLKDENMNILESMKISLK